MVQRYGLPAFGTRTRMLAVFRLEQLAAMPADEDIGWVAHILRD
jgi:hypothetical protein